MSIADEVEKLQRLRESGALSEEEFARAKEAVLRGAKPADRRPTEDDGFFHHLFAPKRDSLGDAAHRYVTLQIVLAVVGVIIFLVMLFGVILPNFSSPAGRPFP